MSSLLSKIFGSGKKHIASLCINDDCVQIAQISGDLKTPHLLGLNKIVLSKGIVENGEIKLHSEMQNILSELFSCATPQPLSPGKLYIGIPFEQLYPFIRVFPKGAKDRIKSDMDEAVSSEIPFPLEEVDIIYNTKTEGGKMISSAIAVPKNWEFGIKHVLTESGYIDLEFIPEPNAQLSLSGVSDSGNTILFSFADSRIFVSVFYYGLLYDSYLYKKEGGAESLFTEYQNINKDFKNCFGTNIENVCFADYPDEITNEIKKTFSKEKVNIVFIRPENKFFSDLLDSGYSASLAGIVLMALEG